MKGDDFLKSAEIKTRFFSKDLFQLLPGIFDRPAEKAFCLAVQVGKDFFEKTFVFCVAVGLGLRKDPARSFFLRPDWLIKDLCVRNASEIWDSFIIPGRPEGPR